jgi:hypothetical protein
MNDDTMKVDLTTSDDEMMDTTVTTLSASTPSILPDDKENNRTSTSLQYNIPWVEKFRPRALQDVLGNEETVLRLRAIAKDGNLPNLILCGPPGTGTLLFCFVFLTNMRYRRSIQTRCCSAIKSFRVECAIFRFFLLLKTIYGNTVCTLYMSGKTTSVHALARELLGSYYKDAVLELNASDARGIDVRCSGVVVCSFVLFGCCWFRRTFQNSGIDITLNFIFVPNPRPSQHF